MNGGRVDVTMGAREICLQLRLPGRHECVLRLEPIESPAFSRGKFLKVAPTEARIEKLIEASSNVLHF